MNQINHAAIAKLILSISLLMVLSVANADRKDDTPVLDVDASGTVNPLTDGLMILRSMFGFTDDALTDSAVDLTNCQDCDSEEIEEYIADVRGLTFGKINSTDDQNISGSALNGTTLTIGIENGESESVDLSGLIDGIGVTSDQADAITANTAKTGITSDQADAITANTAKTGITSDQADAIVANTAKTGITSDQASAIAANTIKTGITTDQASAITANTAKTGITSDQASAITANTAKTGITADQASAITANTAKTGITSDQASAITANTAKTGITSEQASAITANTAKSGTDDQNISGSGLSGTTLTIGIEGGNSETVNLSSLTSGFSVVPRAIATSITPTSSMKTFYSQFSSQKTMTVSKISVWGGNFAGGDGSGVTVVAGLYKGVLGDGTFSGNLVGQGSVTTSGTERLEISLTAESGQNLSITELEDLVFAVSISSNNYSLRTFCPSSQNRSDTSRSNSSYFSSLPSDPSGNSYQCFPAFYVH